jgi:hypothetical protein
MIVGLPGDTIQSVRQGLQYLRDRELYSEVQVFNLAVLPGTAFREEAAELGLAFQSRPPYYVLSTPTMVGKDIFGLVEEAQELFEVEFDAPPPPALTLTTPTDIDKICHVDLDVPDDVLLPGAPAQVFTLWLKSKNFAARGAGIAKLVKRLLRANPFTTLQVVLDPGENPEAEAVQESVGPQIIATLLEACQEQPTYLDKFCSWQPGQPAAAKRVIVLLPFALRTQLSAAWLEAVGEAAVFVWRGCADGVLEANEFAWAR